VSVEFPARCVVAGDEVERGVVLAQIISLGLELSGAAPRISKGCSFPFIQAAGFFVLPSLAGTFGLVILEVMRRPGPVSGDSGSPLEIVSDMKRKCSWKTR